MRHLRAFLSMSVVSAVTCGEVCTTILVPAICVRLDPDLTSVVVTVTEGSFTETVNVDPGALWADLVHERPGTYRVEVNAAGYAPWTATNVRVEEDDCHVITVELATELAPLGG